jgi:Ribosomal RNA adenine dimethylase
VVDPSPPMASLHPTIAFVGQMATHWRETGALVPSGKQLARTMAGCIGHVGADEVIVELGPGTGVFTRELLKSFPSNRVIAIEFNHAFVGRLRQAMPAATIIEGCASRLPELLAPHQIEPGTVRSRDPRDRDLSAAGWHLRPVHLFEAGVAQIRRPRLPRRTPPTGMAECPPGGGDAVRPHHCLVATGLGNA